MAGGKKAQSFGDGFEKHFDLMAKMQCVLVIEFPKVGGFRVARNVNLIPKKMPFDRVIIHQGISVYLDLKTLDADRINRSDLREHQVLTLESIERFGETAGYLIWFRKPNAVCFCKASELFKLHSRELASIKAEEMIILGSIEDFKLGRLFSLRWERGPGNHESNNEPD